MKNIVYVENECFVGVTKEGLKFFRIKLPNVTLSLTWSSLQGV